MSTVLLDTSLLVLLVSGTADKKVIRRHKRTRISDAADFELLRHLISDFQELRVTSHCLAETSNLLKQTKSYQAETLLSALAELSEGLGEVHVGKDEYIRHERFPRLGVADSGLVEESKRVTRTITADLQRCLEVGRNGGNVINFNHLRS